MLEVIKEIKITNPYGFIYIITNMINGKKYIGQKMFKYNWQNYLGSGTHIKYAIKKYGKENFNREIVAIVYSKEELNELEIEFIKLHNAVNNDEYYNLSTGGNCGTAGVHFSDETKQKMSESHGKGENNLRYGKHLSDEAKKKIGDANRGENSPYFGKEKSEKNKKENERSK